MRWLLIDAGNTALKWEVVLASAAQWPGSAPSEDAQRWRGTVSMDAPDFADALARACAAGSAMTGAPAPSTVLGCAVTAPDRMQVIEAAIRAANAPTVRWLDAAARFDHDGIVLHNGYAQPERLGADRWHALIGARARYARGALAVVTLGTATTVDTLDAGGRFLGGVIAPGLEMMRSALARGTGRLPLAGGDYVAHPVATDDAIRTGILDAQAGLVERRLRRIREQCGRSVQVVVSGGNALALLPLLQGHGAPGNPAHEPDLVLRGLWHHARALAAEALIKPAG
jgi:type III pantothenate kinase